MLVTKRWCSGCDGEGKLVDVEKYDAGIEKGLPASIRNEMAKRDDDYDEEPAYGDIVSATPPYDCSVCGGEGFYFYIDEGDRFGESLTKKELPADYKIREISGPAKWVDQQKRDAGR